MQRIILLCVIFHFPFSFAFEFLIPTDENSKIWLHNTNYNSENNWVNGKLPCEAERAVFPAQLDGVVMMPENLAVREMILPKTGELLLPAKGLTYITGSRESLFCEANDVHFKRIEAGDWFNPNNWKYRDSSNRPAIPHIELVPCKHDTVEFPAASSFRVKLPELPVQVDRLLIDGMELTNSEWQAFLFSEIGQKQFTNKPNQIRETLVKISTNIFRKMDFSGNICHENEAVIKAIKEKVTCPVPHCKDAVRPYGHACDICGAFLLFNFGNYFHIDIVHNHLENIIPGKYPTVAFHVSKVKINENENKIQIVLVEKSIYDQETIENVKELIANLPGEYGLQPHQAFASGSYYDPDASSPAGWIIFFIFLAIGVTSGYVYFKYHPEKTPKVNWKLPSFGQQRSAVPRSFLFARFDNSAVDGAVDLSGQSMAGSTYSIDKAFDNPMYESSSQGVSGVTHANPVFSDLKKREADIEELSEGTDATEEVNINEE